MRENEGVASQILLEVDIAATQIRNEVMSMLAEPGRRQSTPVTPADETARLAPRSWSPRDGQTREGGRGRKRRTSKRLLRVQQSLEQVSEELRDLPSA